MGRMAARKGLKSDFEWIWSCDPRPLASCKYRDEACLAILGFQGPLPGPGTITKRPGMRRWSPWEGVRTSKGRQLEKSTKPEVWEGGPRIEAQDTKSSDVPGPPLTFQRHRGASGGVDLQRPPDTSADV